MAKYGIYIKQGNISVDNDGNLTANRATLGGAITASEVKTHRKRPIVIEFRNANIAGGVYNFTSSGQWDLSSDLVMTMQSSCASGCASTCSNTCVGTCSNTCVSQCGGCSSACTSCGGCDSR